MPAADPQTTPSGAAILRFLRVTLHVGFAVLLLVAILRLHLADGGLDGAATPEGTAAGQRLAWSALALALAAAYLAGTVLEKRFAAGRSSFNPHPYAAPWLGLVTALWGVLLAGSAEFSWVAFPLFFLHLHVLPRRIALLTIAAMTAAVVASQWVASGLPSPTLPMVLGPMLGAGFAVVTGLAYRGLYQESEAQRLAAAELRRTRAELARTQHEAGVAAERERLAREIHDTLAQGLSSIVLVARAAEKSLAGGDLATAAERFALVRQTVSENLAEARSFVRGLTSPQLQESSLPESLQRLCGETETLAAARGEALRCRFELVGDPAELPPQYSVTLLRAAQASLANVRLHSKASTAVVTLAFLGDEVTLDVYDDGTGFVPEATGSRVAARAAVARPGRKAGLMGELRILLVDDHPVVRAGLRAMLTEFEDFSVAAEAADGDAALRELARLRALGERVDVVLMDLQMGAGMDGVTATAAIRQLDSPPPVLILTTYDTEADILAAVEAGASGYMLKDAPPEQIRQAVLSAAAGQTALAPKVAALLMSRISSPETALTTREVQLLELLATGLTNRAIARRLFISEATVKTHLVHIYGKLGVDNRTSAIALATQRRIIRTPGQ